MKELVKEWTTSELIEFLNSYNRVYKETQGEALQYQTLYVIAFAELFSRSQLLAMLY
jgi:hypothetical protein